MKKIVEGMLENISTPLVFQFRIRCSECGEIQDSRPVRFSKAMVVPETKGKERIYQTIYEQELEIARINAVKEVAEQMNYCPMCKRVVCNRCFMICEDLDMCKHCAEQLEEWGRPVLADRLESTV